MSIKVVSLGALFLLLPAVRGEAQEPADTARVETYLLTAPDDPLVRTIRDVALVRDTVRLQDTVRVVGRSSLVVPDTSGAFFLAVSGTDSVFYLHVAYEGEVGWVEAGALRAAEREVEVRKAIRRGILERPIDPGFQKYGADNWFALKPLFYRVGRTRDTIRIAQRFVTDFASVPRVFRWALPSDGEYKLSAVVHDYLYWVQPCSRQQSDRLFLIAMKEERVAPWKRNLMYRVLQAAGGAAWEGNRAARAAGRTRWLPAGFTPTDSWPSDQETLFRQGNRDPDQPPTTRFCVYGDSDIVP